ncbi:DMT family transporter [Xanthomonas arboricola pv. corylina]|nr:DMT family transporter [Xanthomonas arboricola pv. corylina]
MSEEMPEGVTQACGSADLLSVLAAVVVRVFHCQSGTELQQSIIVSMVALCAGGTGAVAAGVPAKAPLPKGRQWLGLIAIGMLMQCVYFAGTYLAISAGISAGLLALIVSMQPVLVGVASPLLRTPLARPQWMGMLLGFAGAAVVILSKSQVERFTALGMGLAWLSLLGLCGAVLLEKTLEPQPVLVSLTVQYVLGLVVVVPLVLSLETTHLVWTWPLLGALGYLALCNSLLAVALLMLMIRRNEAAKVSAVFFGASLRRAFRSRTAE